MAAGDLLGRHESSFRATVFDAVLECISPRHPDWLN